MRQRSTITSWLVHTLVSAVACPAPLPGGLSEFDRFDRFGAIAASRGGGDVQLPVPG